MTEIQSAVREAINPQIPVVVHPHPFATDVKLMVALEGQSISTVVEKAGFPAVYRQYLRVWIGDEEIPVESWDSTFITDGQNIYLRVVPQKSGKDIFRAIAMVVITAVAFSVAGPAGLNLGGSLASSLGVTSAIGTSIITGLVAAGIATIGYLALNALVPPPGLRNNQQDEKYRLTGSSNQFAPYANIPRIFGKRRLFPLLAARPYSEVQGDDEYLRIALVVGWGPLEITNIRIGETPITAFSGVEYEIREGWANDQPLTLFTRTVTEDNFAIRLEPFNSTNYYSGIPGYAGDYYTYDPNTDSYSGAVTSTTNQWAQRTTAINAVEFSVDVSFPQGLFKFDSKGNKQNTTVTFEVQYSPAGQNNWTNAVWENNFETGFGTAGQITVTAAESSAVRRSGRVVLPASGQYDVRIRRTTVEQDSKHVDLAWWTALRTIKADYPVNQKNLALIALRIKASGQLNGVPQTINCDAESYLPVRSGGTWSMQKTSNPAWAFADLLRRRAGETYIDDSRIDLPAIESWAAACAAQAPNASEPRWTFNHVLEGGSIIDSLKVVASNARALYTMRDGKHSVVRDIQQSVPVQHITPRNSSGYAGSKVFVEYPHALRVLFTNAANGYQPDERIVYDDGYTAANATRFETLELQGCTSATQAFREARYHMAVAKLRPEQHVVTMDIEALRCTLGDLVMFSHDAIGIGIMATRIKARTTSGGNVTTVTLHDDVYFEAAKTYALRVRLIDGSSVLVPVNNPGAGYATTLTLTTPLAIASAPDVGDLCVFGESTLEMAPMIVRKIEPGENFQVTLTLVDAQPGVYTADTGTIPAFNSYITLQSPPGAGRVPPAYISVVRSDDSATQIAPDGTLTFRIFAQLDIVRGTYPERVAHYELQWRQQGNPAWQSMQVDKAQPSAFIAGVTVGKAYEIRARSVSESGSESNWTPVVTHTVVGKTNFDNLPTGLSATAIPGAISLAWTNPTSDDFWQVEVYENTSNNSATAAKIAETSTTGYVRTSLTAADGVRYYWLKAVDTSGNKTAFVGPVSTTAANKGLYITLTNDSIALPATSAGMVTSYAGADGVMALFDADSDVTGAATVFATGTSCTGTINTAADTPVAGKPKGYYRVTEVTSDSALLTLSASYNGQTITRLFSITRVRAGADGNGAGEDAVSIVASRTAIALPATSSGDVASYADAEGTLRVFSGSQEVTDAATFSAVGTGVTGTINTAVDTPVAGKPKGYYRVTALAGDAGSLTLSATYNGVTLTTIFSITKVKAGVDIVSSLPTTGLTQGRVVFLTTDNKLYRYTGTAWTAAVPAADVTGQIVAAQIANEAITTAKFAAGIEPVAVVSSVPGTKSTNQIFNTTDGKLYRWNGTAYVATVPAADITGQLANAQIEAVAASKVTGQLTNAQIEAVAAAKVTGQITSTQITDGAISTAKLAAAAVTANELAANSVVAGKISAGAVSTAELAAGAITTAKIAAGAVTAAEIAAGSIITSKLAAGAVTANELAANSVVAGKISAGAVSTTELAANAVTTGKLAAGAVTANEIAANAIVAGKISAGTITAAELATNAVTADKILAGAVTAGKISVNSLSAISADLGTVTAGTVQTAASGYRVQISSGGSFPIWYGTGAINDANGLFYVKTDGTIFYKGALGAGIVGVSQFASGLRPIETVSSLPTAGTAGRIVFLTTDNKLYRDTGTSWTAAIPATDISGTIADAQLAGLAASKITGQLTNAQIADLAAAKISGQLTNAQLADIASTKITGQLTNAQIADIAAAKVSGQLTDAQIQSVATAKLSGQITSTQITDGAISTAKLSAGAVTANEISAGAITAGKIAANAVTAAEIAAGAITTAKIAAGAVTAGEIAANAITSAAINAGAITTAKLAAGAVTANEIAANAVTAAAISAGAITTAKIAANAVTAGEIAANAVTAAKISAGAVETAKLAAGAVTANEIAAGAVVAGKIAANAVTATEIAAGAVVAGKIAANAVSANEIAANAVTAGKMSVSSLSAITATIGTLRTAATGARTEIKDNLIEVYDANRVRVRIGIW